MKPILEIQSISKRFKIQHDTEPYLSLRDALTHFSFGSHRTTEDFWALQDINFEVMAGESIGIIGRNGAGKSTLLKILAKITPPTAGKIILRGRVASLLEVGTGFHPELTGRENIYLNGSILGMKKKEIDTSFDEIVDFAGTEKFLDTSLKHYSSGMQLRLAFAVAAFLEPEILIIDEVLAVGDVEFQKKCMGKMMDVHKSGRTILFVSHNLSAVENLCSEAILLEAGSLVMKGPTPNVVARYLNNKTPSEVKNGKVEYGDANMRSRAIRRIEFCSDNRLSEITHMGAKVEIKVYFESAERIEHPVLGIVIKDDRGTPMIGINNNHYIGNVANEPLARGVLTMQIPYLSLFAGSYSLDVYLGDNVRDIDVRHDCLPFIVEGMPFTKSGQSPLQSLNKVFDPAISWKAEKWDQ